MVAYREAQLSDLAGIRSINSHYILHTSLTFMRTPPPLKTYIDKWRDLQARGLPYIVAVDETSKTYDGSDLILGYASFTPFRGHLLSYAPTVELSLFVHPDYQSRSIGSDLLNNLLDLVRAGKVNHCAEEPSHDEISPNESIGGNDIQVRNIIAVMAVDPEGKDGGESLRRWYIQRGFVERGRLERVGFKRGQWIDTVYLQFSTP